MAVKFYILMKDKQYMDAVCETFPWWIVFAGAGIFFLNSTAGICTVVFGLLFVMFAAGRKKKGILKKISGGLLGLYDIVNFFSDILSYSRILALGLASAVIAQVVNLIGTMGNGFVGYILMVAVFIIGHLLNLAINLLGTFVHTSRLQYLEFFGRFYEDGGQPFKPESPSDTYVNFED
jgi:V/A-type H+-transporting ATPase subunit I